MMFNFNGQFAHLAQINPGEFTRGMFSHKPDLYETRALIQQIMDDTSSLSENLNVLTEQFTPEIAENAVQLTEELPVDNERALHIEPKVRKGKGWTITTDNATNPMEAWLHHTRNDLVEIEEDDQEKEALFG